MLKNSVVFNAKFRSARVKELLNDFFTPLIAQSKKTMEIPALGGWWNGRFLSAERFMFREEEGIPELPVQKKIYWNMQARILTPAYILQKFGKLRIGGIVCYSCFIRFMESRAV